tara:strand:+ start:6912 stop:7286 length:375 start_codon:yes stop_codon:yes gene_type:complete
MSITTSYSWHVSQLFTQSTPNNYTVTGMDGYLYGIDSNDVNNTVLFSVNFSVPDSYSSGEFTEYANLTQDQITGWITSTLTEEQQEELKNKLSEKLKMFYDKSGNVGISSDGESFDNALLPWQM